MDNSPDIHQAVLLIGPTGSGKTPLGKYIGETGLAGCRCVHFDFGENLRSSVDEEEFLRDSERAVIKRVLEEGALLEDHEFSIAEKILINFLKTSGAGERAKVVLNGLPRHEGQAKDLESIVSVNLVVHLVCTAETVIERIQSNSGGDRTGRTDDSIEQVRKKLALFEERTKPLLAYYREQGAEVVDVEVGVDTSPAEIVEELGSRDYPYSRGRSSVRDDGADQ